MKVSNTIEIVRVNFKFQLLKCNALENGTKRMVTFPKTPNSTPQVVICSFHFILINHLKSDFIFPFNIKVLSKYYKISQRERDLMTYKNTDRLIALQCRGTCICIRFVIAVV